MVTKLLDVVEIVENTKEFILLEITGNRKEVIKTGILDGDEELVRVTKGDNHVITWFMKDGRSHSYNFGISGHTLISENEELKKRAIVELIKDELETSITNKNQLNLPQKKSETKGINNTYKIMYFPNSTRYCIHKNNTYFKHILNKGEFITSLKNKYSIVKNIKKYTASTGCIVEVIEGINKVY